MTRKEAAGIINAIKCSMVTKLKEHEALTMAECVLFEAEPKHGRWIDRGKDMCIRWKCSECGRKDTHIYNYCPDCGANMREVEE